MKKPSTNFTPKKLTQPALQALALLLENDDDDCHFQTSPTGDIIKVKTGRVRNTYVGTVQLPDGNPESEFTSPPLHHVSHTPRPSNNFFSTSIPDKISQFLEQYGDFQQAPVLFDDKDMEVHGIPLTDLLEQFARQIIFDIGTEIEYRDNNGIGIIQFGKHNPTDPEKK